MGVNKRRNHGKFARLTMAAVIATLPLTTVTNFAEARTTSDASFENQYRVNVSQESALLKVAQSYQYKTWQTTSLQNQVYGIDSEVSVLYRLRQYLLQQQNNRWSHANNQLPKQFSDALNQLSQKWHMNVTGSASGAKSDDERAGGRDKGHHSSHLNWNDLGTQFLSRIDSAILQLQQTAIRDLKQWIDIEIKASNPTSTPAPATGLTISSSPASVNYGGIVNYSVQVLDSNRQPVTRSGVKVDFALPAPNNDGTLNLTSGFTDGSGRTSVTVMSGSTPGNIQLAAWIDGTSNSVVTSAITKVVDAQASTTHLVLSSGVIPANLLLGQSFGGVYVTPQNGYNQVVTGDTLRVTTSNASVLSLQSPDVVGGNQQTLTAGNYALPFITAKSYGTATITVTDLSAIGAPSLSYNVTVVAAQPTRVVAVNPLGTQSAYQISANGVVGPFTISVTDAYGNIVPATESIELTSTQVNQIVGAGTGVRMSPTGADQTSIVIPKGQTGITIYVDNAAVGTTSPSALALGSIVPAVKSVVVKDARTIEITYNEPLDSTKVPAVTDYSVSWGTGSSTPKSVQVVGNIVTLTLWGSSLAHGSTVYVSYNQGSDSSAVRSVWGVTPGNFTYSSAFNPL